MGTKHRIDVAVIFYHILLKLFENLEANEDEVQDYTNKLIQDFEKEYDSEDEQLFEEIFGESGMQTDYVEVFRERRNTAGNIFGSNDWRIQAAMDIIACSNGDFSLDGGLDEKKIRKLLPGIFAEVAGHYKVEVSTIQSECTRGFGEITTKQFYQLLLSGLSSEKPNPITSAVYNCPGNLTDEEIRDYISSCGESIRDWLL